MTAFGPVSGHFGLFWPPLPDSNRLPADSKTGAKILKSIGQSKGPRWNAVPTGAHLV
jgi:hypothetical protein